MDASKSLAHDGTTVATAGDGLLQFDEVMQGVLSSGIPIPFKAGSGGQSRDKAQTSVAAYVSMDVVECIQIQQQLAQALDEKDVEEYELIKKRVASIEEMVWSMSSAGSLSDTLRHYRKQLTQMRLLRMAYVSSLHKANYTSLVAAFSKPCQVIRPSAVSVVLGFVEQHQQSVLESTVFQQQILPYITGALAGLPVSPGILCDRTWRHTHAEQAVRLEKAFDMILAIATMLSGKSERLLLSLFSGLFRITVCTGSLAMAIKLRNLFLSDPMWEKISRARMFVMDSLKKLTAEFSEPKPPRQSFPALSKNNLVFIPFIEEDIRHPEFFKFGSVGQDEGSVTPPQLPTNKQWNHCAASDGTFLYCLSPSGVLKLGTGYGATVTGKSYGFSRLEELQLDPSIDCSVACANGELFISPQSLPVTLIRIDCRTLEVLGSCMLPNYASVLVLGSERQHLHVLYHSKSKEMKLDIIAFREQEEIGSFASPRLSIDRVRSVTLMADAKDLSVGELLYHTNGSSAFVLSRSTDEAVSSKLHEFKLRWQSEKMTALEGTSIDVSWSEVAELVYDPFLDVFWSVSLEKKAVICRRTQLGFPRTMPSTHAVESLHWTLSERFNAAESEGTGTGASLALGFSRLIDRIAVNYITENEVDDFDFVPLAVDLAPSSIESLAGELHRMTQEYLTGIGTASLTGHWLATLLHSLLATCNKVYRLSPKWYGSVPGFGSLRDDTRSVIWESLLALLRSSFVDKHLQEHLALVVVDILRTGFSAFLSTREQQLIAIHELVLSPFDKQGLNLKEAAVVAVLSNLLTTYAHPYVIFCSLSHDVEGVSETVEPVFAEASFLAFLALCKNPIATKSETLSRALFGFLQACQRDIVSLLKPRSSSANCSSRIGGANAAFASLCEVFFLEAITELKQVCSAVRGEQASGTVAEQLQYLKNRCVVGQLLPFLFSGLLLFDGPVGTVCDLVKPLSALLSHLSDVVGLAFSPDELVLADDKQWSTPPFDCVPSKEKAMAGALLVSYDTPKRKRKSKKSDSSKHKAKAISTPRVVSYAHGISLDRLRNREYLKVSANSVHSWLLELEAVVATTAGVCAYSIASATSRISDYDEDSVLSHWNELRMHRFFRVPNELGEQADAFNSSQLGVFWHEFVTEREGSDAQALLRWLRNTQEDSNHHDVSAVNTCANMFMMLLIHCYGIHDEVVRLAAGLGTLSRDQKPPPPTAALEEEFPCAVLLFSLWGFDEMVRFSMSKAAMQILLQNGVSATDRLARVAQSMTGRLKLLLCMYCAAPGATQACCDGTVMKRPSSSILRSSGSSQLQNVLRRSRKSSRTGISESGDMMVFDDSLALKTIRFLEHKKLDDEKLIDLFRVQQELANRQATGLQFLHELIDSFPERPTLVHELLCCDENVQFGSSSYVEGVKLHNYSPAVAKTIRDHSCYILSKISEFIQNKEHSTDMRLRAFRAAVKFAFLDHESVMEADLATVMLAFLEEESNRLDLTDYWLIFRSLVLRCIACEDEHDSRRLKECLLEALCRSVQAFDVSDSHIIQVMSVLYSCISIETVREIISRSYILFANFVVSSRSPPLAKELAMRICRRVLPEVFPSEVKPELILALLRGIGEQVLNADPGFSPVLASEAVSMLRLLLELDIWDILVTDGLNVALNALSVALSKLTSDADSGAQQVSKTDRVMIARAMGAFCILGGHQESLYVGGSASVAVGQKKRRGIIVEHDPMSSSIAILFCDASVPEVVSIESVSPKASVAFDADKFRLEAASLSAYHCFYDRNDETDELRRQALWFYQLKLAAGKSLASLLRSSSNRSQLMRSDQSLVMSMFHESMKPICDAPKQSYRQIFGLLTSLPKGVFADESISQKPCEVPYSLGRHFNWLPSRLDQESALHAIMLHQGVSFTWADEPCSACPSKLTAARANFPVPSSCPLFYFEATCKESSPESCFIGFLESAGDGGRATIPGKPNGCSWGADGTLLKRGRELSKRTSSAAWPDNAVVGCGWDACRGTIFFTLFGKLIPDHIEDAFDVLFPAVGSEGGKGMEVNFGGKPFLFDIEKYRRASSINPADSAPPRLRTRRSQVEQEVASPKEEKPEAEVHVVDKEDRRPTIFGEEVDDDRFEMAEQMASLGFPTRLCYVALDLNGDDLDMATNWVLDSGRQHTENHPGVDWNTPFDEAISPNSSLVSDEELEPASVAIPTALRDTVITAVEDAADALTVSGQIRLDVEASSVEELLRRGAANVDAITSQLGLDDALTLKEDERNFAVAGSDSKDIFDASQVRLPLHLPANSTKHSFSTEREASSRSSKDEISVGDLVCSTMKDSSMAKVMKGRWLPARYGVVMEVHEESAVVGFVESSARAGRRTPIRSYVILYEFLSKAGGAIGEWTKLLCAGRRAARKKLVSLVGAVSRHYLRKTVFSLVTHLKASNSLVQGIFTDPANLDKLLCSCVDYIQPSLMNNSQEDHGPISPSMPGFLKPFLNKMVRLFKCNGDLNKEMIASAITRHLGVLLNRCRNTYQPCHTVLARLDEGVSFPLEYAHGGDVFAVTSLSQVAVGIGSEPGLVQIKSSSLAQGVVFAVYSDSCCLSSVARVTRDSVAADFVVEHSTLFYRFEADATVGGQTEASEVEFRVTELMRKSAHAELAWWIFDAVLNFNPKLVASCGELVPSHSAKLIWSNLTTSVLQSTGATRLRAIHMMMKALTSFDHFKEAVDLTELELALKDRVMAALPPEASDLVVHALDFTCQLLVEVLMKVVLTLRRFHPERKEPQYLTSLPIYNIVQYLSSVASFSDSTLAAEVVLQEQLKTVVKVPVISADPFDAKVRPVFPAEVAIKVEKDNVFSPYAFPRWSDMSVSGSWTLGESMLGSQQKVIKHKAPLGLLPIADAEHPDAVRGVQVTRKLTDPGNNQTWLGHVVNNVDISYRSLDLNSSGLCHDLGYCCGCGNSEFNGCRYVCLSCETLDTEFCSNCLPVDTSQAHDENHLLICLRYPGYREVGEWLELGVLPNTGSNTHIGIQCDECGCNPITGNRYMCAHCHDYDLCPSCWEEELSGGGIHFLHHAFIRITSALTNDTVRGFPIPCLYPDVHDFGLSLVLSPKFGSSTWQMIATSQREMLDGKLARLAVGWNTKLDKLLLAWIFATLEANPGALTLETLDPVAWLAKEQDDTYRALKKLDPELLWFRFLHVKAFNTRVPRTLFRTNLPYSWSLGKQLQRISHLMLPNIKRDAWSAVLTCMADFHKVFGGPEQSVLNIKRGKDKSDSNEVQVVHENQTLFHQAFSQLRTVDSALVYGHLRGEDRAWFVKYVGEGSTDEGGPYRELISLMCAELHSLDSPLPLFVPCANAKSESGSNRDAFVPNASCISPERIMQFVFVGQLLGLAMRTDINLDLNFPPLVWKKLLRQHVTRKDLEQMDVLTTNLFKSFEQPELYDLNPENFEHLFGMSYEVLSNDGKKVDLLGTGRTPAITWENRLQWVKAAEKYKLSEMDLQIAAMRKGMSTVVPYNYFYLVSWEDVELAACGSHDFDIGLLKRNTVYYEYSEDSSAVKFMWQVLEALSAKEQQVFLKFVSGLSRLPTTEVFNRKFAVQQLRAANADAYLPKAHTCFFMIDLPNYSTYEVARKKITDAITLCDTIDMDFNEAVFDPDYQESRPEEAEVREASDADEWVEGYSDLEWEEDE